MKYYFPLLLIWLIVAALLWLQWSIGVGHFKSYEEVIWLGLALTLLRIMLYTISNRLIKIAIAIYAAGLALDVAEDFYAGQTIPLLLLDTSLKNIGFLLLSYCLFGLFKKQKQINQELQQEIVKREELEAKMHYEANHDAMTGVGSRKSCFEHLRDHSFDNQWLLYLDLDNFKQVNDTHGHHVGDQVLVQFCDNMRAFFGDKQGFRIGGDEFIAFADGARPELDDVRAALIKGLEDYDINVSVGIVKVEPGQPPDLIIHAADEKMYRDKSAKNVRSSIRNPSD